MQVLTGMLFEKTIVCRNETLIFPRKFIDQRIINIVFWLRYELLKIIKRGEQKRSGKNHSIFAALNPKFK